VFGGSWRHTQDDERQEFLGSGADNLQATDLRRRRAASRRISIARTSHRASASTQSLYVGDTIHAGRVTAQFSLAFRSDLRLDAREPAGGDPGFPTLLPAIVAPAEDKMIDVSLLSPRAGLSYALDQDGHTVLRCQYGLFGSQLGSRHSAVVLGGVAGGSDLLGHRSQRQQRRRSQRARNAVELRRRRPAHPASGVNFNSIDSDFKPPKTHEFVVGIDREVMPNLGVSASVSWRRFTDIFWSGYDPAQQITVYPLVGVTRATTCSKARCRANVAGLGAYHQEYFAPRESSLPPGNGSSSATDPDYHQQYLGLEVQATKRLSDRWMARVGFSSNRHTEHFSGTGGIQDPGRPRPGPTSMAAHS
jgi:hypothetical protein